MKNREGAGGYSPEVQVPESQKQTVEERESVVEQPSVVVTNDDHVTEVRRQIDVMVRRKDEILTQQECESYIDQYLPLHLRSPSVVARGISRGLDAVYRIEEYLGLHCVEGREHIPTHGPFIVVSNHSGGETARLLGLFHSVPFHLVAGEELNFQRSTARRWFLEKLGMIPVRESLAHLSQEEQQALLARLPSRAMQGYKRIIEEGAPSVVGGRAFVRTTVAALLQGGAVGMFPEGLFTYEGRGLRKAYAGVELIAREYRRLTKKDLVCVPVACDKKATTICPPMELADNVRVDDVMTEIAQALPVEERGYYLDH